MNIQQLAKQMHNAFTTVQRIGGDMIFVLKDGSPQWMTDVIHAVHGDRLPNDFIYETIHDCAIALTEGESDEDSMYECIQNIEPEFRNAFLYDWALEFPEYIDEALENFGTMPVQSASDVFDLFQMGQKCHIESIGYALVHELSARAADDEE